MKLYKYILQSNSIYWIKATASQKASSQRWLYMGWSVALACLGLSMLYWLTDWLPNWFGYLLGVMGSSSWLCIIQSQEVLRSGKGLQSHSPDER
jgi:hypothetical protein